MGGTTFRIYKHYELIRIVGSGAFGVVGSGKNLLTNTNVAIKKVMFCLKLDPIFVSRFDRCQESPERDKVTQYVVF